MQNRNYLYYYSENNGDGTFLPYKEYVFTTTGDVYVEDIFSADVDNDGFAEICAVSYTSIYLWDKDGNPKPGWPLIDVAGATSYAQPTFADLDDDGDLEILHVYYDQFYTPSDN